MTDCIFLAGATGVIGRRLAPILIASGWRVVGTTRSADKARTLTEMGVEPAVVDVFDAGALREAVKRAQPSVVVHQLTDLPPHLDPSKMADALPRNARIRDEGTRNLVAAAMDAGARRLIAQSISFVYADGPTPHVQNDPIDETDINGRGVASLERQVLEAPLAGVVLRYGMLYGPGTGFDTASGPGRVHVDAAAKAAELAASRDVTGIYNITEEDSVVSSEKARRELGWDPDWRA